KRPDRAGTSSRGTGRQRSRTAAGRWYPPPAGSPRAATRSRGPPAPGALQRFPPCCSPERGRHPRRGQRPEPRFSYGARSRVLRNQDEVISARSIGLGSDAFDLLPESSLQVLAEADDLADPGGIPGWISVVEEVLRIPQREVAVVHEAFEVPEGRLASE